jgi:hypothetical protein
VLQNSMDTWSVGIRPDKTCQQKVTDEVLVQGGSGLMTRKIAVLNRTINKAKQISQKCIRGASWSVSCLPVA